MKKHNHSTLVRRLKQWPTRKGATALATADLIEEAAARIEQLQKLDSEAAFHVESVLCVHTHFTGKKPYVGWKGLGLALREVLQARDSLAKALDLVLRCPSRHDPEEEGMVCGDCRKRAVKALSLKGAAS